jgi:ParB family transcriptional regulator, chromosome partitioning protein
VLLDMKSEEVRDIPVDRIRPSKFSLRSIDDGVVEELKQSIKAQGLLQPIMVRPLSEESWEVVFGNHRLEACKRLGWKMIPCRVCEMDDAEAFMTAEVENLQKNNFIDPVQEARGFKMLREEKGLTESKIAKGIGKTQQYVSSRSGLLRLEPEIQALITSRLVSAEHGYELSKIEDPKKRTILAELSRKDREDSLNLNELREMAKLTIEELSKDAQVDGILQRDPTEQMRRIEARVMKLENEQAHLLELDMKSSLVATQIDLLVSGNVKCRCFRGTLKLMGTKEEMGVPFAYYRCDACGWEFSTKDTDSDELLYRQLDRLFDDQQPPAPS